MKTGIITFHFVNNFGGALQAYALRKYMADSFGADAEIIDYRHWFIRFTDAVRMFPITTDFKYFKPWLRAFPKMRARRKRFARFMRERNALSRRIDFPWQLGRVGGDYRLLICGSDQIWNPLLTCGMAGAYYLRFAKPGVRRISYAASVGGSIRSHEKMLRYLRDLDAVSVREKIDWLEASGQLDICYHIDPTLLLPRQDWEALAVPPKADGDYILVYFMQKNDAGYSVVQKLKEQTGYKVYDISRYGYQPDCVDESLVDVGPEEFVGLFRGARHVCTNSFHGLIFALIFDKTVDYTPMHRFGGRIEYLCQLLHLTKTPVNGGKYYHMEYDPAEKNGILEVERQRAFAYLEREVRAANDKD